MFAAVFNYDAKLFITKCLLVKSSSSAIFLKTKSRLSSGVMVNYLRMFKHWPKLIFCTQLAKTTIFSL